MSSEAIAWPIRDLVPHAGPMCLLERAVTGDADGLVAEAVLRADGLFAEDGMVGAWVAIELMAQAIAAWAGWQARLRGETPRMGFLLGTRRLTCSRPLLPLQAPLRIEVQRLFQGDNGLGQFDCQLKLGDEVLASATLTVFEPADPHALLEGNVDE